MNKKNITLLLTIAMLSLTACSGVSDNTPSTGTKLPADEVTQPVPTSEVPDAPVTGVIPEVTPNVTLSPTPAIPVETPTEAPSPSEVHTLEEIRSLFLEAMTRLESEVKLDVSDMVWTYGIEIDIKNVYSSVLSEHQELKYTYDIAVSVTGDTAVCTFSYMPYKTGAYDNGVPSGSHIVGSLHDAVVMAQSMNNGTERLPIAITDATLAVDDIWRALSQAGYGWIRYTPNKDCTEIIATPPVGKALSECVDAINESFVLCGEVLSSVVTDGMTPEEKIKAAYSYLPQNTAYDFRYYTDRNSMPYESTVALGALKDGLAICGGYAQAFEMLLTMLGVENYTVSGVCSGEYHMWNYVVLDGVGYYCDPTADRGGISNHFMLTEEELTVHGGYTWNPERYKALQK
ncbi:MAG: transglutaminase domain-containing protein [Lachnospiraceae bacterium]|nr:transglutaminase domain-containing protein [Lachnospiraceae bacterium]